MPSLRQDERECVVTYLMQVVLQSEVARRLGVHQSTINRLWKCLQSTGSTADQCRCGRLSYTGGSGPVYTPSSSKRSLPYCRTNCHGNIRDTQQQDPSENRKARFKDFGLTAHRPYFGPDFTPR